MSINLPVIRYFTPADPYHYTVDNRPLYDIASGLIALKSGIEAISSNNAVTGGNLTGTATGAWPLTLEINLSAKLNSVWCVKLDMWVVENSNTLVNHSLIQQCITGANNAGVIDVSSNTNINLIKIGSSTMSISVDTFTANKLKIIISGYTGPNGYINMNYLVL